MWVYNLYIVVYCILCAYTIYCIYTALAYSFSYLEPVCCSMSSSNCCFLTCIQISQEADQVVQYFKIDYFKPLVTPKRSS